jgi:hypothetical protein
LNVTFRCPKCDRTARQAFETGEAHLTCPHCQAAIGSADQASDGRLTSCLVCPSAELFIRKDFSQAWGVAIVVVGAVVSSIFWALHMPFWTYGVLFLTAAIDIVLYLTIGNMLQCYRCQAQYRDMPGLERYGPFDLETHEKHRQQRLRLAEQIKTS